MAMRYRYSAWDGTQAIPPLDPDDILNALTDDLMNFGDLQHALRNLLQRGMRNPMGDRTQGLRDLLQQLRQQRRQTLDRFNLPSAFEDIARKLEQILEKERNTLDERLKDALGGDEGGKQSDGGEQGDAGEGAEGRQSGPQGEQQSGQQGQQQAGQPGQRGQQQAGQPGQRGEQGQQGQSGSSQGSGQGGDNQPFDGAQDRQFAEMLKNIVDRTRNFLEGLPQDLGGQMKELQNYEFMDPEAAAEFQELMEMLKQAMMQTFFNNLQSQIANMTPEDMARMKEMIRDLNQMLQERMQGDLALEVVKE